ncbi:M20/M25/M40 family metallo-hydrolase [Pleurocapsa sp. CCALA 161]|uniref:M20/M25/M40 family metallo-hydrolase n=1 Tax=Pleurocapsa sp. CCALA 161 TaxID=2107688 RepID=UPI001304BCB4|nr:M20/M25/M40 family metallo-hydrolase [Pleurocapsa sp. CCALA 161]
MARHLAEIGLHHVRVLPGINKGAPNIYADWLLAPGKPTLLLYSHYDVQPVDPIQEWRAPPFKARIIGDNLYARGVSDDQGQLFIHLKAIESYFLRKSTVEKYLKKGLLTLKWLRAKLHKGWKAPTNKELFFAIAEFN